MAAAGFWFLRDSLAARERANAAAMEACQRLSLQFLDGTVAFARLSFVREHGQLAIRRTARVRLHRQQYRAASRIRHIARPARRVSGLRTRRGAPQPAAAAGTAIDFAVGDVHAARRPLNLRRPTPVESAQVVRSRGLACAPPRGRTTADALTAAHGRNRPWQRSGSPSRSAACAKVRADERSGKQRRD